MLDQIKDLFKTELQYTHTAAILQQLNNLINIVHVQYTKDADAKNTIIDLVCQILQSHKDVVAPVEPAVEGVQNAPN